MLFVAEHPHIDKQGLDNKEMLGLSPPVAQKIPSKEPNCCAFIRWLLMPVGVCCLPRGSLSQCRNAEGETKASVYGLCLEKRGELIFPFWGFRLLMLEVSQAGAWVTVGLGLAEVEVVSG